MCVFCRSDHRLSLQARIPSLPRAAPCTQPAESDMPKAQKSRKERGLWNCCVPFLSPQGNEKKKGRSSRQATAAEPGNGGAQNSLSCVGPLRVHLAAALKECGSLSSPVSRGRHIRTWGARLVNFLRRPFHPAFTLSAYPPPSGKNETGAEGSRAQGRDHR